MKSCDYRLQIFSTFTTHQPIQCSSSSIPCFLGVSLCPSWAIHLAVLHHMGNTCHGKSKTTWETMLFHVLQNLGVLHWISLVKWECVWDSTSTGHFVVQTEGCALVTSTCHTFFKSPFIWNVGCHVIRHVIIDVHVIQCYTFLLSSSMFSDFIEGFHQRHTYPYWSDASLEAPVSSGGSPAHSIGGVLGQCWNRVKAVLPNLLTLKRWQMPGSATFPGSHLGKWFRDHQICQKVFEYLRGMWTTCRLVGRWAPTRRRRWQNSQSWSFVSTFSIDNGRLCPLCPKYRQLSQLFESIATLGVLRHQTMYIVCKRSSWSTQIWVKSYWRISYNLRARFLSGASAWNAFS